MPGGHVLAAVVADALDDRDGARVANREALTCRACAEELAARRAVERGVADETRIAGVAGRRRDHDPAAAHRLADVVVRLADEIELDARGEKGAEALARRSPRSARGRDRRAPPSPRRFAIAPASRAPTARSPFVIRCRGSMSAGSSTAALALRVEEAPSRSPVPVGPRPRVA